MTSAQKFDKLARYTMGVKVDAIPKGLEAQFIREAGKKAKFWADMIQLCLSLGLRNAECRELHTSHVDIKNQSLILHDSKQCKAFITRRAKAIIEKGWLVHGRKYLRELMTENNIELASVQVTLPQNSAQLRALAELYELESHYDSAFDAYCATHIDSARDEAKKAAPQGREIYFGDNPVVKSIIAKRMKKYTGYLFPANELTYSNKAVSQGANPVSRQTCYRTLKAITETLKSISEVARKGLRDIKIGLHSARKFAVQFVKERYGLDQASAWIGHATMAMTEKYLDRSKRTMKGINVLTGKMSC